MLEGMWWVLLCFLGGAAEPADLRILARLRLVLRLLLVLLTERAFRRFGRLLGPVPHLGMGRP